MSPTQFNNETAQETALNDAAAYVEFAQADTFVESESFAFDDTNTTTNIEQPFHDSGFLEDAESTPLEYGNGKDFILFNQESDDYSLDEADILDIASVKANHGSIYKGEKNQSEEVIKTGTSCDAHHSARAVYDPVHEAAYVSNEVEDLQHTYSTLYDDEQGVHSLESWTYSYERHEYIAYLTPQPGTPTQVFHNLQSWDEDIDLEHYC